MLLSIKSRIMSLCPSHYPRDHAGTADPCAVPCRALEGALSTNVFVTILLIDVTTYSYSSSFTSHDACLDLLGNMQRDGAQERKALAPVLVLTLGADKLLSLFDLSEREGINAASMERR